jgi:hypothetical protein
MVQVPLLCKNSNTVQFVKEKKSFQQNPNFIMREEYQTLKAPGLTTLSAQEHLKTIAQSAQHVEMNASRSFFYHKYSSIFIYLLMVYLMMLLVPHIRVE